MSTTDLLGDTYAAALQHGLVDLPAEATLVGVVRRPTGWFRAEVDENRPALGPPPELLDEFQERHEAFKMRGMCDEGAHNAAWDALEFEGRYRTHLDETVEARDAVADLAGRLRSGERLVLVCYENTNRKRCHRTLLGAHVAERVTRTE